MKYSAFGIYMKTLVASLILLGSVAYSTYRIWGNIGKADDVKNQIEDRYSYIPSENEGISFLFAVDNDNTDHGIYILVKTEPQNNKTTLAFLPWQLMGSSGTKHRTLDGFAEKGSGRDILKAVNSAMGTSVKKYMYVNGDTIEKCLDTLGGTRMEIDSDIKYETENAYVSVFAGNGLLSGKAILGIMENPDNFGKNTAGLENISSVVLAAIKNQDNERTKEFSESIYYSLIQDADTNLTAEDYVMRENALFYMLDSNADIDVLIPDGSFDITKDNFTPTDEFKQKLQSVFNG